MFPGFSGIFGYDSLMQHRNSSLTIDKVSSFDSFLSCCPFAAARLHLKSRERDKQKKGCP
jgi:hypothetical protein